LGFGTISPATISNVPAAQKKCPISGTICESAKNIQVATRHITVPAARIRRVIKNLGHGRNARYAKIRGFYHPLSIIV